jgi:hypothetical protein
MVRFRRSSEPELGLTLDSVEAGARVKAVWQAFRTIKLDVSSSANTSMIARAATADAIKA